jgi:catechol 2,3-dioxygenase-like lactoylglutathione lyase family enzyme
MAAQVFIDHLTLPVRDFEASKRFYRRALARFGVAEVEVEGAIGWDPGGASISSLGPASGPHRSMLRSQQRTGRRVDAFHAAALAAGGADNGAPGLRRYHPNYYGGYVIDLDGHNVEAGCHASA